jgi:hypothetical protein
MPRMLSTEQARELIEQPTQLVLKHPKKHFAETTA